MRYREHLLDGPTWPTSGEFGLLMAALSSFRCQAPQGEIASVDVIVIGAGSMDFIGTCKVLCDCDLMLVCVKFVLVTPAEPDVQVCSRMSRAFEVLPHVKSSQRPLLIQYDILRLNMATPIFQEGEQGHCGPRTLTCVI